LLRISEADVRRLLPHSKTIELVRRAYGDLALGRAENPPRIMLRVPGGASMFFMPGYIHGQKYATLKAARVNSENPISSLPSVMSVVYVFDAVTGRQVAEVEAEWLTMVRTAASTAVATDLLAGKDVRVLGVFGSGRQALAHIPAMLQVRKFEKVLVYSRNEKRCKMFAEQMSEQHLIPVAASDTSRRVAEESDVIVTATSSTVPVFDGKLARRGSLVNAIGNAIPDGREVDIELARRSRIVVDSLPQALATYGDIMIPLREMAIRESDVAELGDLLVGKAQLSDGEVTLFKSGGLAVLDAIVSNHILDAISEPL
jgi:ornithine cyclodeaminase/alanine dehydrogenase-like protein (mu-crystallin family)